jgi:ectoine hydroxylase-related dioxygenase (phytanoyl-CoA dioxygenase family)
MAVAGFADLDFHAFHREELPRRLGDGRGAMAARAVAAQGSLAFRLPTGDAYTYRSCGDAIELTPGDTSADTVIELPLEAWEGLVHDYESAPGLLYGGRVRCRRGRAMRFVAWEPGLRAMFTGRPVYDPALRLDDRHGRPLDAERWFALDDDPEDMAHFLRTTGYLLVRRVFAADEVAAFRAEAQVLRGEARKGDKLSWWGRNAGGEEVLCRVTRAAARPRLATLPSDPRLLRLVGLADQPLVHRLGEGNGVTVIYKNPDMTEGLSDIPWHRDCGMGGHSVMCPVLICSTFLTPARPETGELVFLPGSWQQTFGFMEATDARAPRGARVVAEPGDVTVHYGDVMHAAPPPARRDLDEYRISAVVGFTRPDARNHRGTHSYNDVLHQREDGQIEHLAVVAERA